MTKIVPKDEWYAKTGIDPNEGRCECCGGSGEMPCEICEGGHTEDCDDCEDGQVECWECDGADFYSAYEERVTYDKEAYDRYIKGKYAYSPHQVGG